MCLSQDLQTELNGVLKAVSTVDEFLRMAPGPVSLSRAYQAQEAASSVLALAVRKGHCMTPAQIERMDSVARTGIEGLAVASLRGGLVPVEALAEAWS